MGFPRSRVDIAQRTMRTRRRALPPAWSKCGKRTENRKGFRHKFVFHGPECKNLLRNLLRNRMAMTPRAEITGLYRYPVKGLSPEPLQQVALQIGQTSPADRCYAIENGPSGFDPAGPVWRPKTY